MKIEDYKYQQTKLPKEGKYIIANYCHETITVYQAFNERIANYAVKNQKFGGNHYSFNRMTWIKPNFMWMMYRAGWGQKENQERILAIKITKEGFNELLRNAVVSSFKSELYESREKWKNELEHSEVRLQWDPDHNPIGKKLNRKAIQIGIKGDTLRKFNNKWIKQIDDLTDFVHEQHKHVKANFEGLNVPFERILTFNKNRDIINRIGLDWKPWNVFIEFIVNDDQKFSKLQQIFEALKVDKSKNEIDYQDKKWKELFSNKFWIKAAADPKYYEWLVDAYSSGEYKFLSCDLVSENTAKLVCETWSAPYGGFESLKELILNFDFEIVEEWS
jgi:hypothetical protein